MINYNSYVKIDKDASIQLDSLRGFSALLVLAAHLVQVFINPLNLVLETPSQIFSQLAVMMFFVLSGFLIGKSITRNCNQNTTFQFGSYIRDRANRILPPFFFSIILVVALYFLTPVFFPSGTNFYLGSSESLARAGFEMDGHSTIGSILFLNGFITETMPANGPLWSLSYEVWYYVLAGLLVLSSNRFFAFLAIALLFTLSFLDIKFLLHSVIWFTGFLLCLIHNKEYKISSQKIKLFNLFWLMLSILFAFLYAFKKHKLLPVPLSAGLHLMLFKIAFGFFFSGYLFLILNNKTKFIQLFRNSANYSYTLYIIHFPILLFTFGFTEKYITNNILNSVIVSTLSFILIIYISKACATYLETVKIFKNKGTVLEKKPLT